MTRLLVIVLHLAIQWLEFTASFQVVPYHSVRTPSVTLRSTPVSLDSSSTEKDKNVVIIALTRQLGKNDKLRQSLLSQQQQQPGEPSTWQPVELPCIAHAHGPDFDNLETALQDPTLNYVVVIKPQAAQIFASAWNSIPVPPPTIPPFRVAVVGEETEKVLQKEGITVSFRPSKPTVAALVQELPKFVAAPRVLYLASANAQHSLEQGLTKRGFQVKRLHIYDKATVFWTPEQLALARQARIACFAGPSAVKGWMANYNKDDHNEHDTTTSKSAATAVFAACIGETSAQACRQQGWPEERIFYPEYPGIEGWVQAVAEASRMLQQSSTTEQQQQ